MLWVGMLLVGTGLALAALVLWAYSQRRRGDLGLPAGRVVSADTSGWRACERPLFSKRYRLTGRPDYLVQAGRSLVPVEIKPGRTVSQPYPGDVLQLGAYLLLIEEATGQRPSHGLLRYREQTFEVPYSRSLRASVIAELSEMRRLRSARRVAPQHNEPQRCLHCGHREHCEERLA